MNFRKLFLFTVILSIVGLFSCGKDDPIVEPTLPRASFTFTVNDLEVSFTSTSTNATSYAWDFGDGTTGTGAQVSHTYQSGGDYTVKLKASNTDGENETTQSVTVIEQEPYHTSGYLLNSFLQSSAGFVAYAGYFPELPSGDIDLTQYESFPSFVVRGHLGKYIYSRPIDGTSESLVKFAIDKETNRIVEVARLPTLNNIIRIKVISDEIGFYTMNTGMQLNVFNPTTMTDIGSIDLSAVPVPAGNDNNWIAGLIYNDKTGKLIAPIYTDNSGTGQFYDDINSYVGIIDVASQSLDKIITHNEASYPIFRGEDNSVIDEDGNAYLISQGSYGLDLQVGPTAAKSSRPQILKINANEEFEEDYAWNPINLLGFENNFFQLFVSMVYAGNGKAYGVGTSDVESPELLALLQKLATNTITQVEFGQLRTLVFAEETMSIMEVDLINKTATIVPGISKTAGFAYPYLYFRDGKVHAQVTANQGTFNGYYEIDVTTGTVKETFNISQGGLAGQFVKLGE